MTSDLAIDIDHLVGIVLGEPDEEGDCLRCACTMSRPEPELEPTPLCHLCAQAVLPILAREVQRLRASASRTDPAPKPRAQWVSRGLRCPFGVHCERKDTCRLWHTVPGDGHAFLPPRAEEPVASREPNDEGGGP